MKSNRVLVSCMFFVGIMNVALADPTDHSQRMNHSQAVRFSVALIGDLPYSAAREAAFFNMMDAIDQSKVAFVVHDGDFKSGSSLCDDAIYHLRLSQFNDSRHPFFYVFGDNEWTDCHRTAAGGFDPFERLSYLRSLFSPYRQMSSFGQKRLHLERQSPAFPENIRWTYGGVMFVGLHIPGSNNGLSTAVQYQATADTEYQERNAANLEWLQASFALATEQQVAGVMLFIQANPWDFIPADRLTGYEDFLVALEAETRSFAKPVVLVHGDSHYFRVDKPLPSALPSQVKNSEFPFIMPWDSSAPRLHNFRRVETFGNPNSHWVKATIDRRDPNVFSFEQQIVQENIAQ